MIFFRADGNAEIGTGHIMRCLSIAQAVRELGHKCMFITADHEMTLLLEAQKFPYICLHSVWNDLDRETAQMEELIRRQSIRLLLIDSYFVTPDYLHRLHCLTHTACIDDLNPFVYPCSTLINYNIYACEWDYPDRYPATQLLLGPQYAPLRSEFQNIPERFVQNEVRDVLVTTGGTDAMNVAGRFVECAVQMSAFSNITFHIIVGRFNPHQSMLERLADACPRIKLHRNVQRMSKLMLDCDAAVSAAGTTIYELCTCGTPTVVYALADNQLPGAMAAASNGLMMYAGDVRENNVFPAALCGKLAMLLNDYRLRGHISKKMQQTVDGNGAVRLAKKLILHLLS